MSARATAPTPPTTPGELERDWRIWHQAREAQLGTEHGWLSLTAFAWLGEEPAAVADLPGRWSTHGGSAVLSATAADGLSLGSEPVHGTTRAEVSEVGSLSWVRHGDRLVELVRRGGRYAVRVRDPRAATRTAFRGVPSFDVDPVWVRPGRVTTYDVPRRVVVGSARDDLTQEITLVGVVTVDILGTSHELAATAGAAGTLSLAFHDETNGTLTAPWRAVTTSSPTPRREVTVDLNRTVNLPFAFTDHGTCPAPVPGNRLPVAVTAGERRPR